MKKTFYLLTAFCIFLSSCNKNGNEQNETESKEETFCLNEQLKKTTKIVTVSSQPIEEQLTLPGKIDYNENDLVAFRSLLEGIVDQVRFELGDYVTQGQVLATIKSTQIQELYQQKRSQEGQIALLQKQIHTKRELLNDGLLSAPEVLEIEHELANAKIELERINQSLQLYRATGNGSFQILAPKNGYIIQKAISSGQSITAESEPLFSISNLKQVWVMVNIYASNLRYIKTGDAVKVRTIAFPDQIYNGKIDKIYNVFDDDEHVLKARVVLENQNLNLMPGLSADIVINKNTSSRNAFAIPNNAVVFHNNNDYIVIYTDDCHLKSKKVTIISKNEEWTYIEEDLSKNDKVISTNALIIFEQLNL